MSADMRHSKIVTCFLAGCCLIMAIGLGIVVGYLMNSGDAANLPPARAGEGGLGLPNIVGANGETTMRVESAAIWDSQTGSLKYEQNAFEQRPIASLTKIMTAMVALDYNLNWEKQAEILPQENVVGGKLLLHPGEYVTMYQLLQASLLGSANNATLAYVRESGIDKDEFVTAMNRKAVALGLENTKFVEVTGLDPRNVSTAYEVARMAEAAFRDYPVIGEITSQESVTYLTGGSGREHTIKNTNKLITDDKQQFQGSKTGFLYEAGYCLVVRDKRDGRDSIAVVLGGQSEDETLQDLRELTQTAFAF